MKVEHAKIIQQTNGSKMLSMTIDGKHADVYEPHLLILQAGYIALLDGDWEETLPPVTLPPNWHPDYPNAATLRGFTDDPAVIDLARRFVAREFPLGEMAIPSLVEARHRFGVEGELAEEQAAEKRAKRGKN